MSEPVRTKGIAAAVDAHIGERMRKRRLTLPMAQIKLAEALGVTFQQVQKYERGANRIAAARLLQAARALEVPITYFYEGFDGYEAPAAAEISERDAMIRDFAGEEGGYELAAYFLDFDEGRRQSLLNIVRAMDPASRRVA